MRAVCIISLFIMSSELALATSPRNGLNRFEEALSSPLSNFFAHVDRLEITRLNDIEEQFFLMFQAVYGASKDDKPFIVTAGKKNTEYKFYCERLAGVFRVNFLYENKFYLALLSRGKAIFSRLDDDWTETKINLAEVPLPWESIFPKITIFQ